MDEERDVLIAFLLEELVFDDACGGEEYERVEEVGSFASLELLLSFDFLH